MADKVKILITSSCKIGGKHVERGTLVDIDPDNATDRTTYALLWHAGRVAEATKENISKLNEIIEHVEEIAEQHRKQQNGVSMHEGVAAAVVKTLIDLGIIKPGGKVTA